MKTHTKVKKVGDDMKIINYGILGKKGKKRLYKVVCSRCNCEFSFKLKDANMTEKDYGGQNVFIHCPQCKLELSFNLTELCKGSENNA